MAHATRVPIGRHTLIGPQSNAERSEMIELGLLTDQGDVTVPPAHPPARPPVEREAVCAPRVLNEAHDYAKPSSFSRAISFVVADTTFLMISGTASVDELGRTIHVGDFRAQLWRTFRNITELLRAAHMTWNDIVRTSCYLRDIDRDYEAFNEIRTTFYEWLNLDPLPASTGIQASLCRSDLLVEIEAIAIARNETGDVP